MGLTPSGRPRRTEVQGLKKARKIWLGQHPEWVLGAILAHTTPQERFEAVWELVAERADITYDPHATVQNGGDTYVPYERIEDLDDVLRVLGDLPVRICQTVAESPCLAGQIIDYAHWVEDDWAGWSVLIGNLGYIRLSVQVENYTGATWKFLVQRNDGFVVSAYRTGRHEENYCPLGDIRRELEQLLTVQISTETYERLRRGA